MASKVFKNTNNVGTVVANRAGGKSVALSAKESLAKYVTLCTFNDTFYSTGKEKLDELSQIVSEVTDNKFIAKCAVYGHKVSGMKDSPAFLLMVLYKRDKPLFEKVFPLVVDSGRMLRTFVQIARSDVFKQNLSSKIMRRTIQKWFNSHKANWLFSNSLGDSPSFKDILKMTHIKGGDNQDLFSYFLGKEFNRDNLPNNLKSYLDWKDNRELPVPDVNFRLLDTFKLSKDEWSQVLKSCSWNTLRMNLSTFTRHGVFDDRKNLKYAANKLVSEKPTNVFPYEVYVAYRENQNSLALANALNEVMENAVENIPLIKGKTIIAIDVSGSMYSKIHDKSSISCVDAAAMFGSTLARRCEDSNVVTFDSSVRNSYRNSKESILPFAKKLVANGGGTSISSVLDYIKFNQIDFDNLIIVSDNESWADSGSFAENWNSLSNGRRKIISIDLIPNRYTNVSTARKNSMFVSGFNDNVLKVAAKFLNGDGKFVEDIEKTELPA